MIKKQKQKQRQVQKRGQKQKQNTTTIAAIVAIVGITAAVFVWAFAKKIQAPTTQQQPPLQEVKAQPEKPNESKWKTFQNDKYSLEIKIPSGWLISDNSNRNLIINQSEKKETMYIDIEDLDSDEVSIQEWVSKQDDRKQFESFGKVAGMDAVRQIQTEKVYFIKGNKVFVVGNGDEIEKPPVDSKLFADILLTLRFVN